jgi:hypothetical protein
MFGSGIMFGEGFLGKSFIYFFAVFLARILYQCDCLIDRASLWSSNDKDLPS